MAERDGGATGRWRAGPGTDIEPGGITQGRRAAAVAATALITFIAILIDKPTPQLATSLRGPGLIGVAEIISVLGNPIIYCVPGAIAFFVFKLDLPNRDLAKKTFLIAFSPVVAGLTVNFCEIVIGRPGPMLPRFDWQPFTLNHDFWSFPSEHAAVAAAGAAAVSLLLPEYRVTLFALAILVGGTRLVMGVHYPTDLVAGFLLGLVTFFAMKMLVDWFDAWWMRHHPASMHDHDRDHEPPPDLPL